MALPCTVIQVTAPAVAGSTVHTGVGFQGTFAIIFGTRNAGQAGLDCKVNIGVDDGAGHLGKSINPGRLFSGDHVGDGYMSQLYSFISVRTQPINELICLGYIQSFDADGITIQWDFILVPGTTRFYVAVIGGITPKVFGLQPTTNPYATITPGFPPTGLFGFQLGDTFDTVLLPDWANLSLGCSGDIACGQAALGGGYKSFPAGGLSVCWGYQQNGEWITTISNVTGAIARRLIVTSLDPQGFTVSQTGGGTYAVGAFNGCAVNVGVFNQPPATGPQIVPILADQGQIVVLYSFNKSTSTVSVPDQLYSFGVGSASGQNAIWAGTLAGQGIGAEKGDSQEVPGFLGASYTPTGSAASTLNSRVTFTGFASQQLLLDWDTVDGTTREWAYMVLAVDIGTGPCGEPLPPPTPCVQVAPSVPAPATPPTIWNPSSATGAPGRII